MYCSSPGGSRAGKDQCQSMQGKWGNTSAPKIVSPRSRNENMLMREVVPSCIKKLCGTGHANENARQASSPRVVSLVIER